MKLLWHSNAPWVCTGYGQQTALVAPRLVAAGHDVALSAFYGLAGGVLGWEGIRVYPGGVDAYGNDVVTAHAAKHFDGKVTDGVLLTLVDAWVMNPVTMARANWAPWTPVDHSPVPPKVLEHLAEGGAQPIAMSRFGEQALKEAGLDPLYCPHGIDTELFQPQPRAKARDQLQFSKSKFIVGMVAANKGAPARKSFAEAIRAFSIFRRSHDDAFLYLHTEATGIIEGVDLLRLLATEDVPQEAVRFCDQYQNVVGFPAGYMALAYNCMNVLLNPATGEGFGIPIIEAQACGTPVITTRSTSMTELGEVGWQVGGQDYYTYQNSYQVIPDVEQIVWALEECYKDRDRQRERAREFALQYDADRVFAEHWVPTLAELERRFAAVEVPAPDVVVASPQEAHDEIRKQLVK